MPAPGSYSPRSHEVNGMLYERKACDSGVYTRIAAKEGGKGSTSMSHMDHSLHIISANRSAPPKGTPVAARACSGRKAFPNNCSASATILPPKEVFCA